ANGGSEGSYRRVDRQSRLHDLGASRPRAESVRFPTPRTTRPASALDRPLLTITTRSDREGDPSGRPLRNLLGRRSCFHSRVLPCALGESSPRLRWVFSSQSLFSPGRCRGCSFRPRRTPTVWS